MLRKYQDMNDGLPLTLTLRVRNDTPDATPQTQSSPPRGARQPSISLLSDLSEPDMLWEPSESPYDIPGELVLARERRTFTQYWPAKLMAYIPARNVGEKAQYQVLFYDGKVKKLPDDSDMFYNEVHPNFKSCLVRHAFVLMPSLSTNSIRQLGEDENNYGLHIGERDQDTEMDGHDKMAVDNLVDESLRSPSPEPQVPAPLAFAASLTVEEQFRYVKPVLVGILTGQFQPAKEKHIGFMKGGKQRNAVVDSAWKRGEVTTAEKEALSTCIVRWMQRRQKRQDMGLIPQDPFITNASVQPSSFRSDIVSVHRVA